MTKCKICDNISRETLLAILWNWNSSFFIVNGLESKNWEVVVCFLKKEWDVFSAKRSHRLWSPRSPRLMSIRACLSRGKGIGAWSWSLTSSRLRMCAAETQLFSGPMHCWRGAQLNIGTISECTSSNATTISEQCIGKQCGRKRSSHNFTLLLHIWINWWKSTKNFSKFARFGSEVWNWDCEIWRRICHMFNNDVHWRQRTYRWGCLKWVLKDILLTH